MTITLYGPLEDVLLVQAMIATLTNLEVQHIGDPLTAGDKSGWFRIHIAAALTPAE